MTTWGSVCAHQRSEVRGRRAEVRSQKSEVGGRLSRNLRATYFLSRAPNPATRKPNRSEEDLLGYSSLLSRSFCLPYPGLQTGVKAAPPHLPALAEKPGEAKPGQFSGLPVLNFTRKGLIFRRILG